MRRIETSALLVRGVPYGESDLVATFFTETDGKVGAIVRGARRSSKRFGGALEPMHELSVLLEDNERELVVLKEARVVKARLGLTASLEAMEDAGRALRWVRHLCPVRTPEPAAWARLAALLDLLDARRAPSPEHLARFGLHVLADVGYALEWHRCVRCRRPCPEGKAAMVDAAGGGLVCTRCGGARRTLSGELRAIASKGGSAGPDKLTMTGEQAKELLEIVEEAMAAHTDFDRA